MKRLVLLLLSVLALARAGVAQNVYPRIAITLHCTNAVIANNIWQAVTNRVSDSDKFNDGRNIDVTLRTNAVNSYSIEATYLFLNTNRAENVWQYLTNRATPAQTSGRITFHFCPAEGLIRDWAGCDTADYRELKWP
jgi:hypothetical protein